MRQEEPLTDERGVAVRFRNGLPFEREIKIAPRVLRKKALYYRNESL